MMNFLSIAFYIFYTTHTKKNMIFSIFNVRDKKKRCLIFLYEKLKIGFFLPVVQIKKKIINLTDSKFHSKEKWRKIFSVFF